MRYKSTIARSIFDLRLAVCVLLLATAGCDLLAAGANKILPGDTVQPKYLGLAGQSVGVMVWTDRGVQLDYPTLALDLANSVQHKMLEAHDQDELKKSTFPIQPASIVRYQEDHPDLDVKNITEVAPKFGLSRLIYIEVEDFGTRAPSAVDLFRGSMNLTLKIVEIDGHNAKTVYEEDNVKATYPPKVSEEGTPDGDDVAFYHGTIDASSTEIMYRLISHDEDQ